MNQTEKADKYYKKMTETPVHKLIISLGIPTTVSMLITNIYNLADTYFVGTLGESAQAATGVLFTLQAIIQAVAFMLGHGSGTYVSKALATKDTKTASTYASTAFFAGGAIGLFFLIFGLIFLTPLSKLLGSTETILPYAKEYGFWVLLSCPFLICSLILNNNLRYEGSALFSMIGLTAGGVLNIFGDYLLVEVYSMGIRGAGLATAVSQVISFFILLILYKKKAQGQIKLKYFSFKKDVHINVLKGGLPSLLRQGFASFSNGLLNNFTKSFGDTAIAAVSIVNRFSSLVLAIGLGVGQGYQPVAAFNYTAGKYKRVKKGLIFTWLFSTAVVATLSITALFTAPYIVKIFQKSPEVIEIGKKALRFSAIGLTFLPTSTCANMLFQSIRKASIASFLATLRSGVIFIPVLVIAYFSLGLLGIQIAQPLADIIASLICVPFAVSFLKNDHKDAPLDPNDK